MHRIFKHIYFLNILLIVSFLYGFFILFLPVLTLLFNTYRIKTIYILHIIRNPVIISAYRTTFVTALLASILNIFFGLMIAWVLVRYEFKGKKFLDTTLDLPFALPTSVGGLTLMIVYSDQGWIGSLFSWIGIKIVFSRLGVLIAMMFVSLPFVVRTIQPVLLTIEKETEEAAWSLGASSWTTFWNILFPILVPSLLTGTSLGFSRAIGEYGSIVLISSNIPMKDLVVSVLIFQRLEQYDYIGTIVIATMILLTSFSVLIFINIIQLWREDKYK